ncbi:universal stress protein, partial [Methanoculleus chikugoensis]|uniref:universal stress protein n=1 Tax=Methanoculleus chikugoensis TaxID=118126 RepID=UPI001FB2576E
MALISDAYLAPPAAKAAARGRPVRAGYGRGKGLRRVPPSHPGAPAGSYGARRDRARADAGDPPREPRRTGAPVCPRRGGSPAGAAAWNLKNRPVVVGVDGSDASYAALHRAATIAAAFDAPLEAVAVYDPFFHAGVFPVIADACRKMRSAGSTFRPRNASTTRSSTGASNTSTGGTWNAGRPSREPWRP